MSTNTTATTATAAERIPAPVPTLRTDLAPPFGTGWSRVIAPVPKGYTASATLNDNDGSGVLTLNAKPHPPDAKTTIGWYWAGWQRRVSVQLATVFHVEITEVDVEFRGGGVWKPRCFVTLRPVGGVGEEHYGEVLLGEGGDPFVAVVVPQSPILPASVQYDLKVNFNVRAVYSGDQNPRGTLRARIRSVHSHFNFPTLAEGASETAGGDDALDPKELGAALADLDRNAEVSEIGAGG